MHLGSLVHRTVAFLGYANSASPGGITCIGTGFFLSFDGEYYLITARHVAENLERVPFVIRLNKRGGGACCLELDEVIWRYPTDTSVDLAAIPLRISSSSEAEVQYFTQEMLLSPEEIKRLQMDVGDECHTVGLFRFFYGSQGNFPLVHTGHIALMPPEGERIPVWNETGKRNERVEGYLIEGRAIDGASGAPVLARASFALETPRIQDETGQVRRPMFVEQRVRLLGLFQGAWFSPPDEALVSGSNIGSRNVVPVGIGVVVPSAKIVEFLNQEPLKQLRKQFPVASDVGTTPVTVVSQLGD